MYSLQSFALMRVNDVLVDSLNNTRYAILTTDRAGVGGWGGEETVDQRKKKGVKMVVICSIWQLASQEHLSI